MNSWVEGKKVIFCMRNKKLCLLSSLLYQFLGMNTNFIAWETRIRMHSVGCPFDCLWSLQKIFAACSGVKLHTGTGRIFEKLRGHIWKGNQLFSLFHGFFLCDKFVQWLEMIFAKKFSKNTSKTTFFSVRLRWKLWLTLLCLAIFQFESMTFVRAWNC